MGTSFGDLILAALISSGVVSAVVAVALRLFLDRRLARISEEIKSEFEQKMLLFRADRECREGGRRTSWACLHAARANQPRLSTLEGKERLHRDRGEKKANTAIRDLLLLNGHLIPAELLLPASELIEHYDRWLEEFERVRGGEKPDPSAIFVFAGPHGYPFPKEAEAAFKDVYKRMWAELYAAGGTSPDRIAAPP